MAKASTKSRDKLPFNKKQLAAFGITRPERVRKALRSSIIDPTWSFQTQLHLVARRGGRLLDVGLILANESWIVIAAETSAGARGAGDVFEDHQHRSLGEFPSLDSAARAAEAFANSWLTSGKALEDPCACPEIGASGAKAAPEKPPRRRTRPAR